MGRIFSSDHGAFMASILHSDHSTGLTRLLNSKAVSNIAETISLDLDSSGSAVT